jgi:hypothetical protein
MYNETIEVFKETVEKLRKHEKDIESRLKKEEIYLEEILDEEFMTTYTSYDSLHEFITHSKLFPQYKKTMNKEMLESVSIKKFDQYIQKNTSFSNWKEFFHIALEEFIKKNFGFFNK